MPYSWSSPEPMRGSAAEVMTMTLARMNESTLTKENYDEYFIRTFNDEIIMFGNDDDRENWLYLNQTSNDFIKAFYSEQKRFIGFSAWYSRYK